MIAIVAAATGALAVHGAAGAGAVEPLRPDPDTEADGAVQFVVRDGRILEASGLAVDAGSGAIFVIQDAGTNVADVYAIGPTGDTVLTLTIPGVVNEDWEDIEVSVDDAGAPTLWIGDIGDAHRARSEVGAPSRREYALIRMPKPEVDMSGRARSADAAGVERWTFTYEDGDVHNGEALLVQPGSERVFVVDKVEDASSEARMWVGPDQLRADEPNVFTPVATVPVVGVSGGAFASDGARFVLRNDEAAFVWRVDDGDVAAALAEEPDIVPLPRQRQGEGVDFTAEGTGLLVNSEGANQPVHRVALPGAVSPAGVAPAATALDDGDGAGRVPVVAGAVWVVVGVVVLVLLARRRGAPRRRARLAGGRRRAS